MKENLTIIPNSKNNIERNLSERLDNEILTLNYLTKSKTTSSDFMITTITSELTTKNELLNTKDYNPNEKIFKLKITGKIYFGSISWYIYKTPKQIKDLFEEMNKELQKNDNNLVITGIMTRYFKIMKSYSIDSIYENIDKITEYIRYFYNETKARESATLKEALSISAISFFNNNGIKPFEGYAYKKAEPRILRQIFKVLLSPLESVIFKQRNKRWIILKDDMICYINDPNKTTGKNVYWFDENIEVNSILDDILEIKNLSFNFNLKFETKFERDLWLKEINKRIDKKKDEIIYNNYHSFTSQKDNCKAKWFIDGEGYFNYLYEQLKNAKESVYITDWFLSPAVALKRPINYDQFIDEKNDYKKNLTFDNASRLMDILYLLAKKGVQIYILIFYEIKIALGTDSLYAKTTLNNLHPNIKVTRHPKGSSSILWSHHEKLVIIDQKIAFVGGIDLCWGRFDTNKHPIVEKENKDKIYYYPGADYINERCCDVHDVDKFYLEQTNRNKLPRMGWHDIHTMVEGPVVSDIVRHFIERWNYARSVKRNNQLVRVGVSFHGKHKKIRDEKSKQDFKRGNSEIYIKNNIEHNNINKEKNFIPFIKTGFIQNEFQLKNKIANNQEENDYVDKIFIKNNDKINSINDNNNNTNNNNEINITSDNFYKILEDDNEDDNNDFMPNPRNSQYIVDDIELEDEDSKNKVKLNRHIFRELKTKIKNKYHDYKSKYGRKSENILIKQKVFLTDGELKDVTVPSRFKIQALRSVCSWSIGLNTTEHSILEGYYKLIDNAKHYIYIENQFFITKPFSEEERNKSDVNLKKLVENEIGLHIRNRIELAYEKKENFKVFICIPLLPGFSGVPGETSTLDCVLKHTYQSIGNNKGYSLLELLYKKLGKDLENYIYFFSLRNHGIINDIPVTELIYIHSKLLIVDDQKVLIGSANINDRSMLGERDSEFAVIMEEEKNCNSLMDNKKYEGSNYAISLRKSLMSEHFGIDYNDPILNDPLNDNLWNLMKAKASNNTKIYDLIFDCYPHNKFNNFEKFKKRKMFKKEEEIENLKLNYNLNINNLNGHIVEYPYNFLKDEELGIDFFSKENLLPEKNFI